MFFNFDVDDFLIHERYGVGRFRGIETIMINETSLDYFKIEYLNNSFILIPSYNISVFKFHSNKNSDTKIEALGKSSILKKREKLMGELNETAQELINIYQKRESIVVPSFHENDLYQEFCKDFQYVLTKGQEKAIKDILEDLSKSKPMDRLLCGDVGFGKTEVAARAIALCITNSYKAIFIVPTTILASQHYASLKFRFEKIGKTIGILSKLNESSFTIKKQWLNDEIDVLITTAHHKGIEKLLIDNVGLIVLDEEHHFGVKFKEKIRLKAHSLQLSATPIPRTLHLSLSKIKDISLLEQAPVGRKEVAVNVSTLDELDFKKLILDEIEAKGKVFLVVPRVQLIDEIKKLITFAKFTVLHGQMKKDEMNESFKSFSEGDCPILISTNIIESGMNILSANLMIIFYSHMFGVAQLHQLKGRVGRSSEQGRIFFVVPKVLREISLERIKMIQKNSSLGGGFSLSMQDMELRGSGTVVGDRQSGKDYGFGAEMYFDMLSECLGERPIKKTQTKIAWVGFNEARIPEDYILDEQTRFAFYKKLSAVSSLKEFDAIYEDLTSFGVIPDALKSFLNVIRVNLLSLHLQIQKVVSTEAGLEIIYNDISLEEFVKISSVVKVNCVEKKFSVNEDQLINLLSI